MRREEDIRPFSVPSNGYSFSLRPIGTCIVCTLSSSGIGLPCLLLPHPLCTRSLLTLLHLHHLCAVPVQHVHYGAWERRGVVLIRDAGLYCPRLEETEERVISSELLQRELENAGQRAGLAPCAPVHIHFVAADAGDVAKAARRDLCRSGLWGMATACGGLQRICCGVLWVRDGCGPEDSAFPQGREGVIPPTCPYHPYCQPSTIAGKFYPCKNVTGFADQCRGEEGW